LVGDRRAMSRGANGMSIISWSTSWKPICWLGELHQRKQANMYKDSEFRLRLSPHVVGYPPAQL
jgi:hypothetical protein